MLRLEWNPVEQVLADFICGYFSVQLDRASVNCKAEVPPSGFDALQICVCKRRTISPIFFWNLWRSESLGPISDFSFCPFSYCDNGSQQLSLQKRSACSVNTEAGTSTLLRSAVDK